MNNPSIERVDFLIAGTQKGGTTALASSLRKHPDIRWANRKEVHFFDNEHHFLNAPDYSLYHSAFDFETTALVTGEATPIYMYWESAARRICRYNPNMKFVLALRNPIDRAYSHWNMEVKRGADEVSFHTAITNEKLRCETALPQQHRTYSYVDRGFYTEQIERLWKYFPKQQILCVKSNDLRLKNEDTLVKICEFLEIEPCSEMAPDDPHATPYEAEMYNADRALLVKIYENEIKKLERLLGWNCSDWIEAYETANRH